MIKNIVFDMGNVLLSFDPDTYVKRFCDNESDAKKLLEALFLAPAWKEGDRGTASDTDILKSAEQALEERLRPLAAPAMEHWHDCLMPIDETNALARELHERGYRLFLLSNTSRRFYKFRDKLPVLELFDGEFISADVLCIKPERRIYKLFFEKFSLKPEECFFIDDMADNIVAAAEAGMRGFVYAGDIEALRRALPREEIG